MKKGDKVLNRPIVKTTKKKHKMKNKVKHLANPNKAPKIQQLWAINEYQKTAYP